MSKFLKTLSFEWFYLFLHVKALLRGFIQGHRLGLIEKLNEGFCDHRSETRISPQLTSEVVHRIIRSFREAKSDQAFAEKPYQVGKWWQEIIEQEWAEMLPAITANDFETIGLLLENFHRSSISRSTLGGYGDYNGYKKHPFLFRYLFIYNWCKYRDICKRRGIEDRDLSWPLTGNPVGIRIAEQVLSYDALRHFYYAKEIASLLKDVTHPVICEIGGGIGGIAFATRKTLQKEMTYILIDLPESLIVSSYFLQMSFPEERVLLLGEEDVSQVDLRQYGIVLLPNHALPRLSDRTVDLFYNASSFSEMNAETASRYVTDIERICDRYFMHVNHDIRFTWKDDQGGTINNLIASEIRPDPHLFRTVQQRKGEFNTIQDEIFFLKHGSQQVAEHHVFLYERL
jgi:putative sugar O-methyltransferase